MAWNEPGNSGGKDPWGQRNKQQGPPDLDQVIKNIQNKLAGLFGGGKRGGTSNSNGGGNVSGFGIGLVVSVALLLWLISGWYVVQQGERGVLLKFGQKGEIAGPGLHWHWPYPIESVEKVNVDQVSTLWIGRRGDKSAGITGSDNGYMLTEDENIIVIEFSVQYKIKDASHYLFNTRDPVATVLQATESAVREIVGKSKLDFVMTEGQLAVADSTRTLLQKILDRYQTGIQIVAVQMQKASPPDEVKMAFEDAIKAREDGDRYIQDAKAYENDIIPRARGAAERLVQESEGYKASVMARAEGDARRFTSIVGEYAKVPGVTRERMYIETMEQVLSNTTKIYVDQKAGNNVLYLPLDRLTSRTGGAGPVNTLQPLPELQETTPAVSVPEHGRENLRDRGGR